MNIRNKRWLSIFTLLICGMLVATGIEAKKPIGEKPDNPKKTKAECIFFTGDLMGMAKVEGCCPNAGPFPAYTMTFTFDFPNEHPLDGTYDGQLFMNFAADQGYKVQFWSWDSDNETPGVGDIFFEIYGGDILYDKKNKDLYVAFSEAPPTLWLYDDWVAEDGCCASEPPVPPVSFELVKTSDLTYCE